MTIEVLFDRDLSTRLKSLLSIHRREPIRIRLVSQHIHDFPIDKTSFYNILIRLKTIKAASITILVDKRKFQTERPDVKRDAQKLIDVGIKLHTIRNLHAKIITVENNQEKCLLVTSANLSGNAYNVNHETGLYFQNHDEDKIYILFQEYITNLLKNQGLGLQ